jgi:hypothetical protein
MKRIEDGRAFRQLFSSLRRADVVFLKNPRFWHQASSVMMVGEQ